MTGTTHSTMSVTKGLNAIGNGVMTGKAWAGTITYAFPTDAADYSYTTESSNGFAALTDAMKSAVKFAIETDDGNAANDGFSIEGFTNAIFDTGETTTSTLRFAQSNVPSTAYAYYPSAAAQGGDMWFGTKYDYTSPQAGNYGWHTMLHEIGHALGLKHSHEAEGSFGIMPAAYDSVEYTVMSYRAYAGAKLTGYTYSTWSAPQTYMMGDIAALQQMYGADYTTNSGDTVYKWSPDSGDTYVDGVRAIDAGGNTIFATIWDGGGSDTYDLSDYSGAVNINLAPGMASTFASVQLATLGVGKYARGNIYNAMLFNNNAASMIENAVGGAGGDIIAGNQLANHLSGLDGNDKITGLDGNDSLEGGGGNDYLDGGNGNDTLLGGNDTDTLFGAAGDDSIDGGAGNDIIKDTLGNDTLAGGDGDDQVFGLAGNDILYGDGGNDLIYGGIGNDTLYGGDGNDRLFGDAGNAVFYGGAGTDTITGNVGLDTISGGEDGDFVLASSGNDVVYGDGGDDTLYGGIGNDTIYGGEGNDKVFGDASNNVLYGDAGNDTITGNTGLDSIFGGDDDDMIIASLGNDVINGGAGNDGISGGAGNDMMTGGDGADIFIFESAGMGRDTIVDFDVDADFLKLGSATMQSLVSSSARQVGENTVITFSTAGGITLLGFDVADVSLIHYAV